MTKIENQTAVTFTGETTKLPSGAIIRYKGVPIFDRAIMKLTYTTNDIYGPTTSMDQRPLWIYIIINE